MLFRKSSQPNFYGIFYNSSEEKRRKRKQKAELFKDNIHM